AGRLPVEPITPRIPTASSSVATITSMRLKPASRLALELIADLHVAEQDPVADHDPVAVDLLVGGTARGDLDVDLHERGEHGVRRRVGRVDDLVGARARRRQRLTRP